MFIRGKGKKIDRRSYRQKSRQKDSHSDIQTARKILWYSLRIRYELRNYETINYCCSVEKGIDKSSKIDLLPKYTLVCVCCTGITKVTVWNPAKLKHWYFSWFLFELYCHQRCNQPGKRTKQLSTVADPGLFWASKYTGSLTSLFSSKTSAVQLFVLYPCIWLIGRHKSYVPHGGISYTVDFLQHSVSQIGRASCRERV